MPNKFSARQTILSSALPVLGTLSNAQIDVILSQINSYLDQLRLAPHPTLTDRVVVSSASFTKQNSGKLGQVLNKLMLSFDGAQIDFTTGTVYAADGTSSLGINFTPFTIPSNEFFYYSVAVLPSVVGADNTITGQLLVLPASASHATLGSAPKSSFGSKGINLGQVYVQNVGGNIAPITYANIIQLGVGGGSGTGTGDANSFLEDLKRRLEDSSFAYVTSMIFSQDEEALTDATPTTASYSVADSVYNFTSIGEILQSIDLYDAEFLTNENENSSAELHALWTTIDPLATYQLSRDGGVNWSSVIMERIGASSKYRGVVTFPEPTVLETLKTYSTAVTPANIELSANYPSFAMPITIASKQRASDVSLYVNKVGSPIGKVWAKIVKDSTGAPSLDNSDIITELSYEVSEIATGDSTIDFDQTAILIPGNYWVVVSVDSDYLSTFSTGVTALRLNGDTAETYSDGNLFRFDGSAWATVSGSAFLFRVQGISYELLVKITSGTVEVALEGLGIFYGEFGTEFTTSYALTQNFDFDGDDNIFEFDCTNFLPDPRRLKVYDIKTGQVYVYGAFTISGYKVIFPSGTFQVAGEMIALKFDQSEGGGFDNSDTNASLLAENGLGSEEPTISMASPGKGPLMKSPNGSLWRLSVTDAGEILTTKLS